MGAHLGGEHWISVYERQRKLKRLLEIEIMLLWLYWLALLFNVSVLHREASFRVSPALPIKMLIKINSSNYREGERDTIRHHLSIKLKLMKFPEYLIRLSW